LKIKVFESLLFIVNKMLILASYFKIFIIIMGSQENKKIKKTRKSMF